MPKKITHNILVVSENSHLEELVRLSINNSFIIHYAQNKTNGLNLVAEKHPDIIIIGDLKLPDEATALYRQLKDGWISRHSSGLVIQSDSPNHYRILSDKDLLVCGEHTILTEKEIPLITPDQLPTVLAEKIRSLLSLRINKFKSKMLDPSCFCLTLEQIPGPGAFEARQEVVLLPY